MAEEKRLDGETGLIELEERGFWGGPIPLRVRVVEGPDQGLERLLESGGLVVGTSPEVDLVLSDRTVSRRHLEIALVEAGVRVRDLGSRNGTFVGEHRIESAVLPVGSELRLGRTRLAFLSALGQGTVDVSQRIRFGRLVGQSQAMRQVFALLERAAKSQVPVWIHGEAGVGKTLAARPLHDARSQPPLRREGILVELDLSRGAQAGDHLLKVAKGGTVLLDRIDEAPLFVQQEVGVLLDRAEREEADVAWVAVSRADPRELVEGGWLRRDLYFHLASLRITLPPLRERREDLPLLIDAIARDLGYPEFRLSPEEIAQLRAQPMEGNVRELRRIIEEALLRSPRGKGTPLTPDESAFAMTEEISRLPFKEAKERLLEAFERNYIAALLERAGGNLARAADEAGMDRSHFARLARKHGLR